MLRIFGHYNFSGAVPPATKKKMLSLFETKNRHLATARFSRGKAFILFETVASNDAVRYFYHDDKDDLTCFVVGHIHAFGLRDPLPLLNANLAQWVASQYKKGSWDFVAQLRGIFNIVLCDKNALFLVNDVMGLSPMYLFRDNKGCFFCTEAEPIMRAGQHHRVDDASIAEFLVYGWVPDGRTFIFGLEDQKEATAIKISGKSVSAKTYGSLQPKKWKNEPRGKRLRELEGAFREAVDIRCREDKVLAQLTGGWDTRFILAHLLALGKKPVVFTWNNDPRDVMIAQKIAKAYGLTHIIQERRDLGWAEQDGRFDADKKKQHPTKCALERLSLHTYPMFCGQYGTELFGCMHRVFSERTQQDLLEISRKFLKRSFLKNRSMRQKWERTGDVFQDDRKLSPNRVLLFLSQMGRAYLNATYENGWERPTRTFFYGHLLPFTDTKFVSLLACLDNEAYFNYKAYSEIYKALFPEFSRFPWTYGGPFREVSLRGRSAKTPFSKDPMHAKIYRDRAFIKFLHHNPWFWPSTFLVTRRIKEAYFLFQWVEKHRSLLGPV